MDLFNKAKNSFAMAGKELTQKANDVSGIARINIKLKEEEKQLQDAISNLGQQFMDLYPDEVTKKFPEIAYSIKNLRESI